MNQELINNNVFISNIESLLKLSEDSLNLISEQQNDFVIKLQGNNAGGDWMKESSHISNADWILLNSIFISIFSHFEFRLFKICKIIEKNISNDIKLEHLSGSGITKFYNYLNLIAKINCANKKSENYSEIKKFQKIRNLLVHNGGIIRTDMSKNLEQDDSYIFLRKHKVRVVGSIGMIRIINTEIIKYFSQLIITVTKEMSAEINNNYD